MSVAPHPIRSRARARALREIALVLCVLVVGNGAWLCLFARLGTGAPLALFATTFDLINTALAPLLIAMALAALLAWTLRPMLGIALTTIVLAIAGWQLAAVLAEAAPRVPADAPGTPLRVLTVNAFHDNRSPALVRAVIEQARPDIVMVEESDGAAGAEVVRTLPAFHRVFSCGTPPCSLTVLSRWPARRVPIAMPGERYQPDLLFTQIAAPFGIIEVVAVHLPRGYRPVAAHFRTLLADSLVRHQTAPMILGGDFNLPTGAEALAQITEVTGMRRADRWIATYPANRVAPAFAAIDHMFVDPRLGVSGCSRLPFTGSDHYGIGCGIIVPRSLTGD